jgi:hypothetical protein
MSQPRLLASVSSAGRRSRRSVGGLLDERAVAHVAACAAPPRTSALRSPPPPGAASSPALTFTKLRSTGSSLEEPEGRRPSAAVPSDRHP